MDGWPNRDLNVGAIVASAPDLSAFQKLLGVPEPTVRKVLNSWGPGKFDAELILDGKAFRPNGRPAAVQNLFNSLTFFGVANRGGDKSGPRRVGTIIARQRKQIRLTPRRIFVADCSR